MAYGDGILEHAAIANKYGRSIGNTSVHGKSRDPVELNILSKENLPSRDLLAPKSNLKYKTNDFKALKIKKKK